MSGFASMSRYASHAQAAQAPHMVHLQVGELLALFISNASIKFLQSLMLRFSSEFLYKQMEVSVIRVDALLAAALIT